MKRINKKNNYLVILLLLVIGLRIGYALLSQDLTISGVGNNITIIRNDKEDILFFF